MSDTPKSEIWWIEMCPKLGTSWGPVGDQLGTRQGTRWGPGGPGGRLVPCLVLLVPAWSPAWSPTGPRLVPWSPPTMKIIWIVDLKKNPESPNIYKTILDQNKLDPIPLDMFSGKLRILVSDLYTIALKCCFLGTLLETFHILGFWRVERT